MDDGLQDATNYDYEDEANSPDKQEETSITSTTVVDLYSMLCKDHGKDISADCSKCTAVQIVVGPDVLRQLGAPSVGDTIPDTATWFNGAKPQKKPTLTLPPSAMAYGKTVYSAPPFQPRQK